MSFRSISKNTGIQAAKKITAKLPVMYFRSLSNKNTRIQPIKKLSPVDLSKKTTEQNYCTRFIKIKVN